MSFLVPSRQELSLPDAAGELKWSVQLLDTSLNWIEVKRGDVSESSIFEEFIAPSISKEAKVVFTNEMNG